MYAIFYISLSPLWKWWINAQNSTGDSTKSFNFYFSSGLLNRLRYKDIHQMHRYETTTVEFRIRFTELNFQKRMEFLFLELIFQHYSVWLLVKHRTLAFSKCRWFLTSRNARFTLCRYRPPTVPFATISFWDHKFTFAIANWNFRFYDYFMYCTGSISTCKSWKIKPYLNTLNKVYLYEKKTFLGIV